MSALDDSPQGFDYSTAVGTERDPVDDESQVAEDLQSLGEIEVVGWSGTREAITVRGENALMLVVTTALDHGFQPTVHAHEIRADGVERAVVTVDD